MTAQDDDLGESQVREMRELIIEELNALAAKADIQREWLRTYDFPPDELHNQLADHVPSWLAYLRCHHLTSDLAERRLDALMKQLDWMYRQGPAMWQFESLESGPWTVARELAHLAADALRAAGPEPTSENEALPTVS